MEVIKQKKKAQLLSELKQQWEYANNTTYDKTFRANQLVNMINDLTFFLYDGKKSLSEAERYFLARSIRAISCVLVEKSAENKKAVISALNEYEALSLYN